jgi:OPA family sugar phosphate sensor protein UhpC-like MFS transporter
MSIGKDEAPAVREPLPGMTGGEALPSEGMLPGLFSFFGARPARPPIADQRRVARLYRRWRWSVFLSITLGYAFFYTTRLSFSVAKKPLLDSGLLSADQMGKIGFALLLAYAGGKFANGFIADHVNPARFMATGLLLSAVTNLAFGLSSSYFFFLLLWGVNGWLQSIGAPVCGVSLSAWFSNRERGTRYAVWSTSHNLGEAASFALTALLVSAAGWRWGFLGPGMCSAAASLLLYHTLADRPASMGLPPVAEFKQDRTGVDHDDHLPLRELQLEVLRNPRVWLLAISSALMYVARYGVNHWGVLYLQVEKSYSLVEAGFVVSLFPSVGIAGSALSGIISDRLFGARRSPVTLAYGVLFVAALCVLYFSPPGHPFLIRLSMAVAGFAVGGLLVFLGGLTAMDISSKRASGAAMGLVGGVSYVGAALQDWASGSLIERSRQVVGGVVSYDFTAAKYVWIGAASLSLVLALSLWRAERPARQ